MIVVDTSAIIAIMIGEPIAASLGPKILASEAAMAAPSMLEAHMVLSRHLGPNTGSLLAANLAALGISVIPFTEDLASDAAVAFEKFGKGRHPAALNFGDCMAYALAKRSGSALLFTGNDFPQTDVAIA